MESPEKNDLFYRLMQDAKLHSKDPGLEDAVLQQLRVPANKIPKSRFRRLSILFLSLSVILGLTLCGLFAFYCTPAFAADRTMSLVLETLLIGTFLFLLEKIIKLLSI